VKGKHERKKNPDNLIKLIRDLVIGIVSGIISTVITNLIFR